MEEQGQNLGAVGVSEVDVGIPVSSIRASNGVRPTAAIALISSPSTMPAAMVSALNAQFFLCVKSGCLQSIASAGNGSLRACASRSILRRSSARLRRLVSAITSEPSAARSSPHGRHLLALLEVEPMLDDLCPRLTEDFCITCVLPVLFVPIKGTVVTEVGPMDNFRLSTRIVERSENLAGLTQQPKAA